MPRLLAALLALVLAGSAWAQPALRHIEAAGLDRVYLQHRVGDETAELVPVVIVLHGLGTLVTEGLPTRSVIPFETLPSLGPALVVRPQGVNRRWDGIPGRIRTWQRLAGTDGTPVDDIAFLRALVDRLVAQDGADPARIYVAGVSSGGFLVPRIACEMGDKVAAVADVIATATTAVFRNCGTHPVPFALIASTTDQINPYAGAPGDDVRSLASAPDTAAFFAQHNGCTTRTETPLPHTVPENSTTALIRYGGCTADAEVLFWRVDGSGHSVPSLAPIGPEGWEASGRRNRDFETAAVLWDFFRTHRLVP